MTAPNEPERTIEIDGILIPTDSNDSELTCAECRQTWFMGHTENHSDDCSKSADNAPEASPGERCGYGYPVGTPCPNTMPCLVHPTDKRCVDGHDWHHDAPKSVGPHYYCDRCGRIQSTRPGDLPVPAPEPPEGRCGRHMDPPPPFEVTPEMEAFTQKFAAPAEPPLAEGTLLRTLREVQQCLEIRRVPKTSAEHVRLTDAIERVTRLEALAAKMWKWKEVQSTSDQWQNAVELRRELGMP